MKQTIRRGHNKRKEIMEAYKRDRSSYKRDSARIKDALKYNMHELNGKKLSKKRGIFSTKRYLWWIGVQSVG